GFPTPLGGPWKDVSGKRKRKRVGRSSFQEIQGTARCGGMLVIVLRSQYYLNISSFGLEKGGDLSRLAPGKGTDAGRESVGMSPQGLWRPRPFDGEARHDEG